MDGLEALLLGAAALAPARAAPGADGAAARAAALLVKQAVERIARLREVGGPRQPAGFGLCTAKAGQSCLSLLPRVAAVRLPPAAGGRTLGRPRTEAARRAACERAARPCGLPHRAEAACLPEAGQVATRCGAAQAAGHWQPAPHPHSRFHSS
jgi:hypothetical protein